MRGGQPIAADLGVNDHTFTPHARGSTQCFNDAWFIAIILPACAGVNPSASNQGHCGRNFPRMREGQPAEQSAQFSIGNSPCMRGGQPARIVLMTLEAQFSPHVRGSTHETDTVNSDGMIHPACAGVTLSREWLYEPVYSPRMRGGQPFHRSLTM